MDNTISISDTTVSVEPGPITDDTKITIEKPTIQKTVTSPKLIRAQIEYHQKQIDAKQALLDKINQEQLNPTP